MKKLSCFALVVAMLFVAAGAFALTTQSETQLSPYAATTGQDHDMFTISGDYLRAVAAISVDIRDNANKWLTSQDVLGFTILVSGDGQYFDNTEPYSMRVLAGTYATSKDLWDNWSAINIGPMVSRDKADWYVDAPSWFTALVRTTKNAVSGTDNPVRIPLSVLISRDRTGEGFNTVTDGAFSLGHGYEGTRTCTIDCCDITYSITCCDPANYNNMAQANLDVWFKTPARAAVYCCGDLPILYWGLTGAATYGNVASLDVPLTVARLNDVTDMVRVRLETNSRNLTRDRTTGVYNDITTGEVPMYDPRNFWSEAFYRNNLGADYGVAASADAARTHWFYVLQGGRYTEAAQCTAGTLEFWPNKADFNSCEVSPDRYWWRHNDAANSVFGIAESPYYAYVNAARTNAARVAEFNFWKDKDLITQADIAFGETLNFGVWYGGAVVSDDDFLCMCAAGSVCDPEHWQAVPRVTVQNLGTTRLDVKDCHKDLADNGICATDCGLCDTMPNTYIDNNARNGAWIDLPFNYAGKDYDNNHANLLSGIPSLNGPGVYFQNEDGIGATYHHLWAGNNAYGDVGVFEPALQFRWGDFWYWDNDATSTANDIITLQCPCYIYPAFTKTIQPRANADFHFAADDGTAIKGRWNTSYILTKLISTPGTDWCNLDECSFLFVYFPCCCEADAVEAAVGKNIAALKDKVYMIEQRGRTPIISADRTVGSEVILGYAAHVINNTKSDALKQVAEMKVSEGDNLVWYDTFNIFEVTSASHTGKQGILPVQLRFTVAAASLDKVDFDGNWRDQVWGDDGLTLKAWTMDGSVSDLRDAAVLNAPLRTTKKEILDWQTMVVADNDEIRTTGRVDITNLTVYLTAFIVDGPAPTGASPFTYMKLDNGNEVLFIFDGVADHQFQNIVYLAKPSTSNPCTINASNATLVVGETQTYTVTLTGDCACDTVSWDEVSSDVVQVVISGDAKVLEITGLKAGSVTNRVFLECDSNISKDVTITVVTPTTTPTPTTGGGSSSGGGCNAGAFAPLMLLLAAPVVLLLKK